MGGVNPEYTDETNVVSYALLKYVRVTGCISWFVRLYVLVCLVDLGLATLIFLAILLMLPLKKTSSSECDNLV